MKATSQRVRIAAVAALFLGIFLEPTFPLFAQAARPRMGDDVLKQLARVAQSRDAESLLGILRSVDGLRHVFVMSHRMDIVAQYARALQSGAAFVPTDAARIDEVVVRCGFGERINEIFECSSLRVSAGGRVASPIVYEPETRDFLALPGARWTARLVTASYPAAALASGFVVSYATPDGVSWTFEVSAADASAELFLTP
jgi:hypothetical protein